MSAEDNRKSSRLRRVLTVLVPLLLIVGGTVGYLTYAGHAFSSPAFGSGTNAASQVKVEFSVTVHHQEQNTADFLWLAQMALRGQFWSASCYFFCNGVSYSLDPTSLITNNGHDFEQFKIFGTAGTITSVSTDVATVIGLSSSATAPAATDTACAGIITSGGLTDVAGTETAGAAGTTVTTTIANTFTAAETDTAVQLSCLLTETHTGAHIIDYAEGTFGPDTLVSGNTLAITWTIART